MIAIAEGISYLLLLYVAMPLKYFGGYPAAVKYTGWLHGLLFLLFGLLLIRVWIKYRWRLIHVMLAFIASLLPFGTFILDHKLKKQYFHPGI